MLNFNVMNVVMIFAALQGILLAFLLLSAKKYRKASNYALACLMLSTSGILLGGALRIIFYETPYIKYFYFAPIILTTVLAISFYFFVQYLIEPNHKITRHEKLIFIPAFVQFSLNTHNYLVDIFCPEIMDSSLLFSKFSYISQDAFDVVFTISIVIVSLKKINKYERRLLNSHSTIDNKSLNWMKNILHCILVLCFFFAFGTAYFWIHKDIIPFYPLWLSMGILIYWGGYLMYIKRDVFEIAEFEKPAEETINRLKLSDNTTIHFSNLLELMSKEQLFLDPHLSMTSLSKKMGLSSGYLSQIINQKTDKNFFEFVNEYRVQEVKTRLHNPDFAHYSIIGIALDAGFNSKSTFNSVFKRIAGETPSSYRKKVKT